MRPIACRRSRAPRALPLLALGVTLAASACVPPAGSAAPLRPVATAGRWPAKTQAHVDLWLHGFAMLGADSAPVPLFRRGYRDSLIVLRNRASVYSALDANRDSLAARLATTPALQNAQFVVFSFPTWEALANAIDVFLKVEGDPRRASDQTTAAEVYFLSQQFPSAADRTWLRRFFDGLADERRAFYQTYWTGAQRDLGAVIDAIYLQWEETYRAKFQRFLATTQQRSGELILSLPLGPEGRVSGGRDGQALVAVPLPGRAADVPEAFAVFAHEVVGSTVGAAVADHTTPAEKRSGAAERLVAFGQVRGGLVLLERLAPELVAPYARYYLAQGGHTVPAAGAESALVAALVAAYPLPEAIVTAMTRQIEIALAGI
jgi:hypothetical protein